YLSSHLLLLFCKLPSPPDIYTLSLHDALPIFFHHCKKVELPLFDDGAAAGLSQFFVWWSRVKKRLISISTGGINFCRAEAQFNRSEEHTSELQSRFDLVCRLLLEKKKITT